MGIHANTDGQSRQSPKTSIGPAAYNSTVNGSGVNLGSWNSNAIILQVGTITDGTHTPKVEESDDNSAWNDVDAEDLIGTLAELASDTNQQVSYVGDKQYVRVTVTVAGATTGGVYGAVVEVKKPQIAGDLTTVQGPTA